MEKFKFNECYIRFLNLPHRNDRLIHMTHQIGTIGIPAERKIAKTPEQVDKHNPKYAVMLNRTPGAIPCHIGQVEIMEEALRENKNAVVLEDDLVFCSDFYDRIDHIEKWSENHDFDIIWLGGTFHSPAFWHPVGRSRMHPDCSCNIGFDCVKTSDERMMRTYGAFCTYAYIVNVNSIKNILDLFDQHISTSIGIDWLFIKIQPELKCYAYVPGCVKQMDNQSDIGKGVTTFSGFSKLNGTEENSRYWWQDKKEHFNPATFEWK